MKSLRFRATIGLAAIVGMIGGYCARQEAWAALTVTLVIAVPLLALMWRTPPARQPADTDQ